jgi:hypothetical protein
VNRTQQNASRERTEDAGSRSGEMPDGQRRSGERPDRQRRSGKSANVKPTPNESVRMRSWGSRRRNTNVKSNRSKLTGKLGRREKRGIKHGRIMWKDGLSSKVNNP